MESSAEENQSKAKSQWYRPMKRRGVVSPEWIQYNLAMPFLFGRNAVGIDLNKKFHEFYVQWHQRPIAKRRDEDSANERPRNEGLDSTSFDCNFHGYPVWFTEGVPFTCPFKCPMQMRVGRCGRNSWKSRWVRSLKNNFRGQKKMGG